MSAMFVPDKHLALSTSMWIEATRMYELRLLTLTYTLILAYAFYRNELSRHFFFWWLKAS